MSKEISVLGYLVMENDTEQLFAVADDNKFYCTDKMQATDSFSGHDFKACESLPENAMFIGHYTIEV